MNVETELANIIERGGGKFLHIFVAETKAGMGALVAFRAPNGERFTLPLFAVTEENVRNLVKTTRGWRKWLYALYKFLSEEKNEQK
jgi:hypothetical protein